LLDTVIILSNQRALQLESCHHSWSNVGQVLEHLLMVMETRTMPLPDLPIKALEETIAEAAGLIRRLGQPGFLPMLLSGRRAREQLERLDTTLVAQAEAAAGEPLGFKVRGGMGMRAMNYLWALIMLPRGRALQDPIYRTNSFRVASLAALEGSGAMNGTKSNELLVRQALAVQCDDQPFSYCCYGEQQVRSYAMVKNVQALVLEMGRLILYSAPSHTV
jgi:hypothetical protein